MRVEAKTENGIEAEKRKQQEFFDLAERFRIERDTEEAKRLGDQLGRMVFGGRGGLAKTFLLRGQVATGEKQ